MRRYGAITIPLGPITCLEKDYGKIDSKEIESLGGYLYWYAYAQNRKSEWYGVLKYKHFEVSEYKSSNIRNQIRKGLSVFEIRRINAENLSIAGYAPYYEAQKLFVSEKKIKTAEAYISSVMDYSGFDDIIHLWGVYKGVELVGYAVIYCYDKVEANISEIRMLPEANREYASYALFHRLSEEYIKKQNFKCISDGYRSLVHETRIQELLMHKFGFEKIYLALCVKIRSPYHIFVDLLFPFRKLIKVSFLQGVFNLKLYTSCK